MMEHRKGWTSRATAWLRRRLASSRSEDGFTIIEVIITAAMVALIAGSAFTGIEASGQASSELRHRSLADDLAQQDQERLRGMSIVQLTSLDQTRNTTVEGTDYTITSKGNFLNSSGGNSCGNQNADYVRVVSEVTWGTGAARAATNPVKLSSIISPPVGGTILVRVADDVPTGQPAVTVQAVSGADKFTALTDSSGCAYFSGTSLGTYFIIATRSGWVTPDGGAQAVDAVGTTAAGTKVDDLEYAQGGGVTATFSARLGAQTVPGEASGLSWNGGTMLGPGKTPSTYPSATPAASSQVVTPMTLFPFHNAGTTANNYEVWAGRCATDEATATVDKTHASVSGGASSLQVVKLAAMNMHVFYKATAVATPVPVKPNNIELTDSCGDSWFATVNPKLAPTATDDALAAPGQAAGTYQRVCADYDPPGATPTYRAVLTGVANTNFATGSAPINLTIGPPIAGNSANRKICNVP